MSRHGSEGFPLTVVW
jgi:protease I